MSERVTRSYWDNELRDLETFNLDGDCVFMIQLSHGTESTKWLGLTDRQFAKLHRFMLEIEEDADEG